MTDKDPKDMTVSELLRKAGNGYEGANGTVMMNLIDLMGLSRKIRHSECLYALADKIDDELAQARELSLRQGAELWAKANGWPDFRDGEDFGAWLERCTYKKPVDDCNEPVQFGDEIELHSDGGDFYSGRFQEINISRGPVRLLSFTGVDHEHLRRYDTECDVIKRPAPEVLLGDGKPVSKGETVYVIESGIERTARDFGTKLCEGMDGWDGSPWVMFDNGSWMRANDLTHERPVIGADGLPIKDDETVYDVETGEAYIVRLPCAGTGKTFFEGGGYRDPAYLTHTPPDTQRKINADVTKNVFEYWGCGAVLCYDCPVLVDGKRPREWLGAETCHDAKVIDLLRRQRELDKRTGGAE